MQLTDNQYTFLAQQQAQFDSLIQSQYISYLDGNWLNGLGDLYRQFFNEPFKANCVACVKRAMTLMYNKMEEYRANKTAQQ